MRRNHIPCYCLCIVMAVAWSSVWAQQTDIMASDFDGNERVEFADFLIFLRAFGTQAGDAGYEARLDLGGNGAIDFEDFLIFASNFGKSPSDPVQTFLYIADLAGGKVDALDTSTNLLDLSRTIQVSEPRGIAFSAIRKEIYISGVDTFYVYTDAGSREEAFWLEPIFELGQSVPTAGGHQVVISKDHRFAYVAEEHASVLEIFDLRERVSLARLVLPPTPRGVAISDDGREVYVAHGPNSETVSIVDATAHTLKDSISVPGIGPSRIAVTPERLYLNSSRTGQVTAIDAATKAIVQTYTAGDPTDLAVQVLDVGLSADGSTLVASVQRVFDGFNLQGLPVTLF